MRSIDLRKEFENPKSYNQTRKAVLHAIVTTLIIFPTAIVLWAIMPGQEHFFNPTPVAFEARVAGPPELRARTDHFDLKLDYFRDGTPRHIWLFLPKSIINPKGCLFQPANLAEASADHDCGKLAPGRKVLLIGVDVDGKLEPLAVSDLVTLKVIISKDVFFNSVADRRGRTLAILTLFVLALIGIYIHAARQIWRDRKTKQARQGNSEQIP